MRRFVVFVIIFSLGVGVAVADTHYVSHSGSDTWPYTSWETAADSIAKAIDAAERGDTVRVAVGTYIENVVLKVGISLVGAGRDSCVIEGKEKSDDVIYGADSCLVEGFHLVGKGIYESSCGIHPPPRESLTIINNMISNCAYAIFGRTSSKIINNLITDNRGGINCIFGGTPLIANNTITNSQWGGIHCDFASPTIIDNVVAHNPSGYGIECEYADSIIIRNNLVYDSKYDGICVYWCLEATIENNTVKGNGWNGIVTIDYSPIIRNNILVENTKRGIESRSWATWTTPQIYYNDCWGNSINYMIEGSAIFEGNISADPMFIGEDDFWLQYGSPCIDAGDSSILDTDSTRSDMGFYGGPGGSSYVYLDLPPAAPESLRAVDKTWVLPVILLTWEPNTESDLLCYAIYRDTVSGFEANSTTFIGMAGKPDTAYFDDDIEEGHTYYYRVRAVDETGNKSEPSNEAYVSLNGVEEGGSDKLRVMGYELGQNFPNPFNATTVISYRLSAVRPHRTTLKIYNILGEDVVTLVDSRQKAGRYEVIWNGRNGEGNGVASGIYLCRLEVKGDRLKVVKTRKMLLSR